MKIKVEAIVMEMEALTESDNDENITGLEVSLVMVGGRTKLLTGWPATLIFISDNVEQLSRLHVGDRVELTLEMDVEEEMVLD